MTTFLLSQIVHPDGSVDSSVNNLYGEINGKTLNINCPGIKKQSLLIGVYTSVRTACLVVVGIGDELHCDCMFNSYNVYEILDRYLIVFTLPSEEPKPIDQNKVTYGKRTYIHKGHEYYIPDKQQLTDWYLSNRAETPLGERVASNHPESWLVLLGIVKA